MKHSLVQGKLTGIRGGRKVEKGNGKSHKRFSPNRFSPNRRRRERLKSKIKKEDIQELMDICQELMKEQQILKKSVKRTNRALGFDSAASTPDTF